MDLLSSLLSGGQVALIGEGLAIYPRPMCAVCLPGKAFLSDPAAISLRLSFSPPPPLSDQTSLVAGRDHCTEYLKRTTNLHSYTSPNIFTSERVRFREPSASSRTLQRYELLGHTSKSNGSKKFLELKAECERFFTIPQLLSMEPKPRHAHF